MRFARGYRKFVANSVDSVLVLALKSPFTTIIIIIMLYLADLPKASKPGKRKKKKKTQERRKKERTKERKEVQNLIVIF